MEKKFLPLYNTNFWGVMNDNLLKMLVCYIAVTWVAAEYHSVVVNATMGILVLPYLIFSPLAGRLPSRFGKIPIIRTAKAAELFIMAVAVLGFVLQSVYIAILSVLLMGLQSALFSPSKSGLIKDIDPDDIPNGMGGMEAVSFFGMLLGSVLASVLAGSSTADVATDVPDSLSSATSFLDSIATPAARYSALFLLATFGFLASLLLRSPRSDAREKPLSRSETRSIIRHYHLLQPVIHYLSVFWWLSASLQAVIVLHCKDALGLSPLQTGILLSLMAIGISVGCVIGGSIDRRLNMVGFSPLVGIFMSILLILTFIFSDHLYVFSVLIFLVSLVGGIFKIPLDAEIQKQTDSEHLSTILAHFNQVSFIYIFLASATNIALTFFFPASSVFLFVGIVLVLTSLLFIFSYRSAVSQVGLIFMRTHYSMTETGRECLHAHDGNILLLPTHRAVLDPLMLFALLNDVKAQPLCDDAYFRLPVIGRVLGLFCAIPVPDLRKSRRGASQVMNLQGIIADNLENNANILFYPSGHITTDGSESIGNRQLAYEACSAAPSQTRIIAIRITGLWGSQWSRYGKKKTPPILPLLGKSALLIFSGAIFFLRKRKVSIHYEDITDSAKQWCLLSRLDFNRQLESFYSSEWTSGVEPVS